MDIVGRNQLESELLGPGDQMAVHLGLVGNLVILQLEIEILRPECFLNQSMPSRLLELVLDDRFGDLAGQATR